MAGDPPQKLFYRIGEIARLLEVKPHVIRFWEKEFKSIRPKKSGTGQRVYNRNDLQRLQAIKHLLYNERFTIEGARKHLREKGFEPPEEEPAANDTFPAATDRYRDGLLATRQRLVALLGELQGTSSENRSEQNPLARTDE